MQFQQAGNTRVDSSIDDPSPHHLIIGIWRVNYQYMSPCISIASHVDTFMLRALLLIFKVLLVTAIRKSDTMADRYRYIRFSSAMLKDLSVRVG